MDYVIMFLVFVGTAHALSCKPCDKSNCELPTNCAGSLVYEVCRCCQVCAKQSNESCGGSFGIHGQCDMGMKCIIQPLHGELITGQETGVCRPIDSISSSDTCQVSEFDGCNVVNEECHCARAPACANPYQFQNKFQCTMHLLALEVRPHGNQAKTDCTNVGCIVRYSPKCPEDSELVDSIWPAGECCPLPSKCECRPEKCKQQLCRADYDRVLVRRASGKPGQCCDKYQCKPKDNVCDVVKCPSPHRNITCPADSVKLTDRMSKDGCCELPPRCECKSRNCHVTKCADGYRPMVIVRGNGSPGTCCDLIECVNASEGVCRFNGTEYQDDERFSIDVCRECYCKKGVSQCHKKQCSDLPPCEKKWTPPGECCPKCQLSFMVPPTTVKPVRWCRSGKESYPPGARWSEGSCTYCVCKEDGHHQCISESCQKSCEFPREVEGECCPVCDEPTFITLPVTCPSMDSCKLTGNECPFGFKSDLGCRICKCREKSEVCPSMATCSLNCTSGFVVNEIGCERCKCAGKMKHCRGMDSCKKECPFGYRKDRNGCDRCRCRRCMEVMKSCDKQCKYGREMNEYGCEICKCNAGPETSKISPESMRSRSCHDESVKHDDGEGWTTSSGRQCVCRGGTILCDMLECPVPHCDHPIIKEGFPCAVCPDSAPYIGDHMACGSRVEGESWVSDECTSCVCNAGRVMCSYEVCKPLPCVKPIYSEGHCCPHCREEKHQFIDDDAYCTDQQGVVHGDKSSWRQDTCTSCKCDGGVISCYGDKCPQVHNCMNPVTKRGQCCPQCLDDVSMNTCSVGDRKYSHGEVWAMTSDACSVCTCIHGNAVCRREICRPVMSQCKRVIQNPGKCCLVCAEYHEDALEPEKIQGNDKMPIIVAMSVVGVLLIIAGIIGAIFFIKRRPSRTKTKYSKAHIVKRPVPVVTSEK